MVLILLFTGWFSFASADSLVVDSLAISKDSISINLTVKPTKDMKPVVRDTVDEIVEEPTQHAIPETQQPRPQPRQDPVVRTDVPEEPVAQSDTLAHIAIVSEEPGTIRYDYLFGSLVLIVLAGFFLFRRRGSESTSPAIAISDEPVRRTNDAHPLDVGNMTIRLGQAQHLGMRRQQQDAFAMSDPAKSPFIAVIADGMGGMKNGAEASKLAIREFMSSLDVEATNRAVFQLGKESGEEEGTGTTLLAVFLEDRAMKWLSVGDSQIYLLRNKELSKVNTEHSYVLDLYQDVIRGQSDLSDARQHPEKDALTSFIGLKELTRIDQSRTAFPLKQADVILMCSDGLYRSLSDSEMVDILSGDSPNPAEELVKRAMAKNHPYQDNTTVITLQIDRIL